MIRAIRKSAFFFMAFMSFAFASTAQQSENDFAVAHENFFAKRQQEKIFVHTDRTTYLAGELIWFKIYNVSAQQQSLSKISKVAYVELLSADQKPVLQAKIELDSGLGNGSLFIPTSVPSGNYQLRAYTSWMKNFSPDFFFTSFVTVINTLRNTVLPKDNSSRNIDIHFFPEGGYLVAGIENTIAFSSRSANGSIVTAKGIIRSSSGDTVLSIASDLNGFGRFKISPKAGIRYTAMIVTQDTTLNIPLPEVMPEGIAMHIEKKDSNNFQLNLHSNQNDGRPVYVIASGTNAVAFAQKLSFVNGLAQCAIPLDKLQSGISRVTIFNELKHPVCERLIYVKPTKQITLNIEGLEKSYASRKNNTLALSASTDATVHMSAAIFLTDSLQPAQQEKIENYFLLRSEIAGEPNWKLLADAINGPDDLMESVLLTHGWRRFNWDSILSAGNPGFEFLPETESHLISGRIVGRNSKPVNNVPVTLSVPGKYFIFGTTTTDYRGIFRFNVPMLKGFGEMIVQPGAGSDTNYRVEMVNPYAEKFASSVWPSFKLSNSSSSLLTQRSTNTQADNYFHAEEKQFRFQFNQDDTIPFFGIADKHYNLDDYTRFTQMEEVLREYVDFVRVRKRDGRFQFTAENILFKNFYDDDALVLVDGVQVDDLNKIIAADPLKFKSIDVIARKFYTGQSIFEGIISFQTYNGDLGGISLNPNAIIMEYDGIQRQREFYSPNYAASGGDRHIPDLRSLLLWNPDLKATAHEKASLQFSTSDIPGHYMLVIQGIDDHGNATSESRRFDVVH